MPSTIPDPRANARLYFKEPALYAVAVDEPWWWPVLSLGVDTINVHFDTAYRGPLAIVSRQQQPWHRNRDVEAISQILKDDGRPSFDAYSCPKVHGRIVGLVNVVNVMSDRNAAGLWFSGPYALKVEKPCMLPFDRAGSLAPADGLIDLPRQKQDSIRYALTMMANGYAQPGLERRR